MALQRDIGLTMTAFDSVTVHTDAATTAGSGAEIFLQSSTLACGQRGRTIDRLDPHFSGVMYRTAELTGHLYSSAGSTNATRAMRQAIELQHGDSSGGGDHAVLSTGASTGYSYFTSVRSTVTLVFSSGPFHGQTPPNYYDLTRAKRYVSTWMTADLDYITTETCGDNYTKMGASIRFAGGDELPWAQHVGIGSTVTASA